VSDDYAHAVNVWQRFSIRTFGEYSDLYLKTDVLLANVFENFRDSCIISYGLDPAYYYTLLDFTWDAMLKYTGVKFEFLMDIMVIERDIRRGLSQCSNRCAYATTNTCSHMIHRNRTLCTFTLITCTAGQCVNSLPYVGFQWINIDNFNVMDVALNSPIGYILEVDLEYLQHLHDIHSDGIFGYCNDFEYMYVLEA